MREDIFTILVPLKYSHFSLPHSTIHKSLSLALLHKRSSLIFRFGYIYPNAYTEGRSEATPNAVGRHTFTYTKSWLLRSWLSRSWLSRSWLSRSWLLRSWLSRSWLSRSWLSRSWLSRSYV
jgi:hypothetical protein